MRATRLRFIRFLGVCLVFNFSCGGGQDRRPESAETEPAPEAPIDPSDCDVPPCAARIPAFDAERVSDVGTEFATQFRDGQAELSGYEITTPRYGEPRMGELVLIYVTEPHDRRTWIKDDRAPSEHRVEVLKLNQSLRFQTGVYPYSILTSIFAPTANYGGERFSPVKITMSVQEWCGHVFHGVWPGAEHFVSQLMSYFASEGESVETVETPADVLYEDALLIQLRELDGPFASGGDFEGSMVPTLWSARMAHQPLRPVPATIIRSTTDSHTEFVLRYRRADGSDYERIFKVEREFPRRISEWTSSDGEHARIIRSTRMPYWRLNGNADAPRQREFLSRPE